MINGSRAQIDQGRSNRRNDVALITKRKESRDGEDDDSSEKITEDCLTFGRVWRGSSTLGELIVASPARRRRPGHPRLSHLSSSYLPRATPAGLGIGRDTGNASTTNRDVVKTWCPTARLLPAGAAFPHGPFCEREKSARCERGRASGIVSIINGDDCRAAVRDSFLRAQ